MIRFVEIEEKEKLKESENNLFKKINAAIMVKKNSFSSLKIDNERAHVEK